MGVYQGFPSKILCLTVPKVSLGESITVALNSGIEKVWIRAGEYQVSVDSFLSHSAEKFRGGILHSCDISVTDKVWIGGGGSIKFLRRKFYVSQCRKFP